MDMRDWFVDEVVVMVVGGVDEYGQPLLGSRRRVKGRLEHKLRRVVDTIGQEVLSDHEFVTDVEMSIHNRIWLPQDNENNVDEARVVHNIHRASDKFGDTTHWVVFL
jgi:hypothetical protein